MSSDELARDVQGAEDMMERHQEMRAEIDARNEKYACNIHFKGLCIATMLVEVVTNLAFAFLAYMHC